MRVICSLSRGGGVVVREGNDGDEFEVELEAETGLRL